MQEQWTQQSWQPSVDTALFYHPRIRNNFTALLKERGAAKTTNILWAWWRCRLPTWSPKQWEAAIHPLNQWSPWSILLHPSHCPLAQPMGLPKVVCPEQQLLSQAARNPSLQTQEPKEKQPHTTHRPPSCLGSMGRCERSVVFREHRTGQSECFKAVQTKLGQCFCISVSSSSAENTAVLLNQVRSRLKHQLNRLLNGS